jgi:hypothetical protein
MKELIGVAIGIAIGIEKYRNNVWLDSDPDSDPDPERTVPG